MAILRLFAIQDVKLGAFSPPIASANEGTCQRTIQDWMRNSQHPFAMHPGDYNLYEVGKFDELTGMVEQDAPRAICSLASLVPSS